MNFQSVSEGAGVDNGKYKIVNVRSVVSSGPNMLGTPTKEYYQKWLPGELVENYDGKIKKGTRPWITSHSVYNMGLSLKAKERRTHLYIDRILSIKIKISSNIVCHRANIADPYEWQLLVMCNGDGPGGWIKTKICTRGIWEEINEAAKKAGARSIAIPFRKELFDTVCGTGDDHQKFHCIENVQQTTREIVFLVENESDEGYLLDLLQEYKLFRGR